MNVLIIEDEALAAEKLSRMLLKYDEQICILDILTSVKDSVSWLRRNSSPDLILLDIHIDDGLCFEIFQQVNVTCPIIFTTAYDQYAIKAFHVHSVDYLLKPIQYEKLAFSLNKFKDLKNTYGAAGAVIDTEKILSSLRDQQSSYKSRFLVKAGTRIRTVKADEIAYIYTERKLNELITRTGNKYPVDYSLDDLTNVLDPSIFFRANRQLIIHIDALAEIHPYFKGRVKIELTPPLNKEIVISSERTPAFKLWLDR